MHVPTRDFGKSRCRMHLDLETEMPGVELDRGIHVVYDIAETSGHGSFLPLLGLHCSSRTYPFHSETSTSHSSAVGPYFAGGVDTVLIAWQKPRGDLIRIGPKICAR